MRMIRARLLATFLLAGAAIWPAAARAQSAQDLATARKLAEQGGELFDAGRYADAIERFQRAEAFFHAPTHVLMIARAHAAKGALVEAQETYNKLLRERLADGAPPAFVNAQADGQRELEKLQPRVPTLEVKLSGKAATSARVEINGALVPEAAIGIARPVNPGEYTIVATAPGYLRQEVKLVVKERDRAVRTLELAPDPAAAPAPVPPTPAPTAPTAPPAPPAVTPPPAAAATAPPAAPPPADAADASDARAAPSFFLIGLGATAVGVGAVALGLGASKTGACPDGECPSRADQASYDNGSSLETLGIGALVVGGVSGLAGAVLLLTSSAPPPATAGVSAFVGAGSAGVRGRF